MPLTQKEIDEKSLHYLLYNEVDGKREPRATDIKQGSIGDCYLLANLIDLARTNPGFIKEKLIDTKNEHPNRVKVTFFENGLITSSGSLSANNFRMIYHGSRKKHTFEVTKEEAVKWGAKHKAFWPTVIEIAYAKFFKAMNYNDSDIDFIKQLVKEAVTMYFDQNYPGLPDIEKENILSFVIKDVLPKLLHSTEAKNLKEQIGKGLAPAKSLVHLTGKDTKRKMLPLASSIHKKLQQMAASNPMLGTIEQKFETTEDEKERKRIVPFNTKYSDAALKMYGKIQKRLSTKKPVFVSFFYSHVSRQDIERAVNHILDSDPAQLSDALMSSRNSLGIKTLLIQKLGTDDENLIDAFSKLSVSKRKSVLKEIFDSLHTKFSQSHVGMFGEHVYCVVGCREHDGYKYVIISNPHGDMTKIDYSKKIDALRRKGKLPREIKTPQDINNSQGECAMELNHFYKKLTSIDYEYDPEEKAYKALREMFK